MAEGNGEERKKKGFGERLLDGVEKAGNKLPDPATLFLIGALLVMVLSHVAVMAGWTVQPVMPTQVERADGETVMELEPSGEPLEAVSLLTSDGVFWAVSSMVDNFVNFAPLGVVLVGMLGIGVAERAGLLTALIKAFLKIVPPRFLDPSMVFIGIMSSLATDAGYVVLPPLAMAIYAAIGRSPMVGLAAVFAGVSAGFNANLLITGLDPLLAGLSTEGAQIIDEGYAVAAPANWYFMIVSTVVITAVGWWTTTRLVAPRFAGKPAEEGGTQEKTDDDDIRTIKPEEKAGLKVAGYTFLVILVIVLAGTLIPGAPLYGEGELFARWVEAIVPLLFVFFIVPGIAYGVAAKTVKGEKQAAQLMVESMAAMAPIIVLSFFAAQFVEYFNESNLGAMMAMSGGEFLASAQLPPILLIITFILVVAVFNLFVGSMSAKYTLFAPIFIPMFMLIGISPELTQAAYRIGDSVSNIITPLNAYLIIILVAMRRYLPKAGMGTLISTMLPYTLTFLIAWTIMLVVWMLFGLPLGPDAPMEYVPSAR